MTASLAHEDELMHALSMAQSSLHSSNPTELVHCCLGDFPDDHLVILDLLDRVRIASRVVGETAAYQVEALRVWRLNWSWLHGPNPVGEL